LPQKKSEAKATRILWQRTLLKGSWTIFYFYSCQSQALLDDAGLTKENGMAFAQKRERDEVRTW